MTSILILLFALVAFAVAFALVVRSACRAYGRTTSPQAPGVDPSRPARLGEIVTALTYYGVLEIAGVLALCCVVALLALIARLVG